MQPQEVKAWRERHGWSQKEAAAALGIGKSTLESYERGYRSEDKRPVVVPKTIRLAMAALDMGVTDYKPPKMP
ncbi:MAG: helix-turn-helix transcriptional regulator [Rhodospirillaceae bacterium]|nr:helix-turn-helix transcriptional regulator [Rhodospirillales bacterium]